MAKNMQIPSDWSDTLIGAICDKWSLINILKQSNPDIADHISQVAYEYRIDALIEKALKQYATWDNPYDEQKFYSLLRLGDKVAEYKIADAVWRVLSHDAMFDKIAPIISHSICNIDIRHDEARLYFADENYISVEYTNDYDFFVKVPQTEVYSASSGDNFIEALKVANCAADILNHALRFIRLACKDCKKVYNGG